MAFEDLSLSDDPTAVGELGEPGSGTCGFPLLYLACRAFLSRPPPNL
jgi:hypothetical protein